VSWRTACPHRCQVVALGHHAEAIRRTCGTGILEYTADLANANEKKANFKIFCDYTARQSSRAIGCIGASLKWRAALPFLAVAKVHGHHLSEALHAAQCTDYYLFTQLLRHTIFLDKGRRQALSYFDQAIETGPGYARAYTDLAEG